MLSGGTSSQTCLCRTDTRHRVGMRWCLGHVYPGVCLHLHGHIHFHKANTDLAISSCSADCCFHLTNFEDCSLCTLKGFFNVYLDICTYGGTLFFFLKQSNIIST